MASYKQVQANRQNAKRSTGPRTAAGKAAVATNALRHGLQAQAMRLAWESEEECAGFVAALRDDFTPVGAFEEATVDSIVTALWRLARLARMESGVVTCYVAGAMDDDARPFVQPADTVQDGFGPLSSQQMRELPEAILGSAFIQDLVGKSALANLDRNRRSLERTIGESLKRLHLLQDRRRAAEAEEQEAEVAATDERQARAS